MKNEIEDRIRNLEELCAHQAAEIESLSETIREQWHKIDGLTKSMLRFRDRLTEVEETGDGHENTRPPHY